MIAVGDRNLKSTTPARRPPPKPNHQTESINVPFAVWNYNAMIIYSKQLVYYLLINKLEITGLRNEL